MNLNEIRDKAYQCAIVHGWHEEEHSNEHLLCLVISELIEAVQADRKGKRAERKPFESFPSKIGFDIFVKDTVEDELADACIRLFDLAGLRGFEITVPHTRYVGGLTFTEFCYYIIGNLSSPGNRDSGSLKKTIDDAIASVFDWCAYNDIDILWHINQKMKYNELRPYKHGNKIY